ncbi:hypothetical protein [Streptomyces sp. NPDC060022]|uniref:hypothetical protein n=1 Tax=Streptomyces sp. NPDC060022 TaxID=3347039 RepID=UPI00368770FA
MDIGKWLAKQRRTEVWRALTGVSVSAWSSSASRRWPRHRLWSRGRLRSRPQRS